MVRVAIMASFLARIRECELLKGEKTLQARARVAL